jgi:hypothetical protein
MANTQELHWAYLNGKPFFSFPELESINGGDVSNRYLSHAGTTEGSTYYAIKEMAYRIGVIESKLNIKYPENAREAYYK